jgi:acyl dehydratase
VRVEPRFLEDFIVGESRQSLGRTVTEADFVIHAGQTGDFFPHHMDAEWMKTQPAGERIAHGTLILSIAAGLTAFDVNPEAMSYGYDRVRFIKPVFIGDTIRAEAKISDVSSHKSRQDVGILQEDVSVINQRGDVVMFFQHIYIVNKREAHGI